MKMLIRCAAICSALLLSTGCSVKRVAINKLGNALASGGSTFTSDDDRSWWKPPSPSASGEKGTHFC